MKLLRVIRGTNPESGGPIEGLLRSSEALIRQGHDVEILCLEPPEVVASREFPFPVTALGRGIGNYGFNPRLTPWIKENARRFDAVVLHGLWNYSSYGAWRALRNQSTPYYVFSHGMMDPWFRDRYPLKHVAKVVYWWLCEGRVLRDAAAVLFTSEEERVRARHVYFGHSYKENVVRYGTSGPASDGNSDSAAFFAAFPALKERRFLLFLGRVHPKKGCDLLIRAFAKSLHKIAPDMDLVIAGPDQVRWTPKLKAMAKMLGVENRVHWPGMLTGALKWGAFHSADALVLPSHQENFGITVAEAMACSTPTLISDKVNIWREVQAANAGFVQADTEEGTLDLILRYSALSAEDRSQMGKAARQGFMKYFDSEAAARDFTRVIGFTPRENAVVPPKKVRVLHVIRNTEPESGGPIEALLRTSDVLLRKGLQVEVVSLESPMDATSRGFPFLVIALGSGITRYGYNAQLAPWIRRNAKLFDVVFLHGLWNYSSFGAWRGLRNQGVPYFIYAHGMMDPWFHIHYPLKHLARIVYWWLIEGRVLRDAAAVLFTCEEERNRARGEFYGHSYNEQVLRFGTRDPNGNGEKERAEFFSVFPALRQKPFLLFLSRIHPKKGCEILLQAFADVAAPICPDLNLVMAGPDHVGWTPGLKLKTQKLGISNRVHWPGMLEGSAKWGAIRSADAMILPSHQENFGLVVAEAMACSTPVLISNKVNIWREVMSSGAGIVEPDTLEGTRNLIQGFLALSEEEHAQMRQAAREGFLRHFDIEAAAADLIKVVGSVLRT